MTLRLVKTVILSTFLKKIEHYNDKKISHFKYEISCSQWASQATTISYFGSIVVALSPFVLRRESWQKTPKLLHFILFRSSMAGCGEEAKIVP